MNFFQYIYHLLLMGRTLLYGTIIGIPTVILAGSMLAKLPFIRAINRPIEDGLYNSKNLLMNKCQALLSVFSLL